MIRPLPALLPALAALALTTASVDARPMSSAMRCADVQRLVMRSGSIVMNFTPTTYDKVVRDQRFCLPSEGLVPLNVPARDTPSCFAGYTCREGANPWNPWN